jgi:hypothetical protein
MKAGYGQGDSQCPCGVHLLPALGPTSGLPSQQPFATAYGNRSSLVVKATQSNFSQGPDLFHAYACFDLYAVYQGHLDWIEDCDYGWLTSDLTSEVSGVSCNGNAGIYISNSFNGLSGDQAYGTNLGVPKNSHQNVAENYGWSTSRAQLAKAISAFTAGRLVRTNHVFNSGKRPGVSSTSCIGVPFDPNPADYHLAFLESGIENWQDNSGDAAGQTESNLTAYTSFQ